MRASVVALSGLCAVACSNPPLPKDLSDTPGRDLQLATAAAYSQTPDSSNRVVSDLEAGRPSRTAPARRAEAKAVVAVAEARAPKLAASSTAPSALVTSTAEFREAPAPVETVMAAAVVDQVDRDRPTLAVGGGLHRGSGSAEWPQPGGGRGGPGVIIRGGRGRVDDDCDLHRPGLGRGRQGPLAIHSLAPRPRGMGGFR